MVTLWLKTNNHTFSLLLSSSAWCWSVVIDEEVLQPTTFRLVSLPSPSVTLHLFQNFLPSVTHSTGTQLHISVLYSCLFGSCSFGISKGSWHWAHIPSVWSRGLTPDVKLLLQRGLSVVSFGSADKLRLKLDLLLMTELIDCFAQSKLYYTKTWIKAFFLHEFCKSQADKWLNFP